MPNDKFAWFDKIKSYFQKENFSHRNLYFIAGTISLLIIAFFVYHSIVYKTQISEFDIKASISDVAGVAPNSHFILNRTYALPPHTTSMR